MKLRDYSREFQTVGMLVAACLLVLGFQNCGEAFSPVSQEHLSSQSQDGRGPEEPKLPNETEDSDLREPEGPMPGDPGGDDVSALAALEKVSGDKQMGAPGASLAQVIAVRAVDSEGMPLSNQAVEFSLSNATKQVSTDENGIARFQWHLSAGDRKQHLVATSNMKSISFSAMAISNSEAIRDGNTEVWGVKGERQSDAGRIANFSHAGYHGGLRNPPIAPQIKSIKEFGAVGDGVTDDTQAFLKAFAEVNGTLFVPEGTYVVTNQLKRWASNFVLRGAGQGKTILLFNTDLERVKGPQTNGAGDSRYSFNDAFIEFFAGSAKFRERSTILARLSASVQRGSRNIAVDTVTGLKVGDKVMLVGMDTNGSLVNNLYGNKTGFTSPTGHSMVNHTDLQFKQLVTVRSISAKTLTLDRPVRADLALNSNASLVSLAGYETEMGVEDLTIRFPTTAYPGHHKEKGQNAIQIRWVRNCWVRNVTFEDVDNGVKLYDAHNCTVEQTRFRSRHVSGTRGGHHALWVDWAATDNLFTLFNIEHEGFVHDLTIGNYTAGNVFEAGSATNMTIDNHGAAPLANLFSNLNVGRGTRIWVSGGQPKWTPQNGMHNVYWNIQSQAAIPITNIASNIDGGYFIDLTTFVGVNTNEPRKSDVNGTWHEAFTPGAAIPVNLYRRQVYRRLIEELL